ncbi:glycoside hydrolase family protein [Sphingobacterium sp. E70]|uniref:glycoside hydrolase family protein n=1 Tax=Sphingobacterium sp. E70 TaxID=2853439 RepID=UPI00211CE168|nr:glycoside hydrolase family protein [Sphingobacterium sp. E70]ULT27940.1 glycoside hydrolase family protein [Sphingobacterium sp. E70]
MEQKYGFGNWVTNSEVVRAIADTPEGPYEFVEVVLPARGKKYFDGCTTHNPRIVKNGDYYVLYYFGNNYEEPNPGYSDNVWESGLGQKAWMHKRIGMAYSKSISGPWKRVDQPILNPRQGEWDASITSNPSPVVLPDGKVYLIYKSSPVNYNPLCYWVRRKLIRSWGHIFVCLINLFFLSIPIKIMKMMWKILSYGIMVSILN